MLTRIVITAALGIGAQFAATVTPTITSLNPPSLHVQSTDLNVEIRGRGFLGPQGPTGATVIWNGQPLMPVINIGIEVVVTVPQKLLSAPGMASVAVSVAGVGMSPLFQIPVGPAPASQLVLAVSPSSFCGGGFNSGTFDGGFAGVSSSSDQAVCNLTLGNRNQPLGSLAVSSTGASFRFQITVNQITPTRITWLTVAPSQGTTPTSANITADTTGLTANKTYTAIIQVDAFATASTGQGVRSAVPQDNSAPADSKLIPVSAFVQGVSLVPSINPISFTYILNGVSLPRKPLSVAVSTGSTDGFTATPSTQPPGGSWLLLSQSLADSCSSAGLSFGATAVHSAAPGTICVGANPAGLSPGTYWGIVSLAGTDASNPVRVDVALNILSAPSKQVILPNTVVGSPGPGPQNLSIDPGTVDSVAFYADFASDRGWLKGSVSFDETPANLILNPDPTGLTAGFYSGLAVLTNQFFADKVSAISVGWNLTAFVINTASLPNGTVGLAYAPVSLGASGGVTPLSWRITGGSKPPGLDISPQGSFGGTPVAAGSYTFTVSVTDSNSFPNTTTRDYTVMIAPPPPPVQSPVITRVVNGASFQNGPIAGYTFVTVFGTGLAPGSGRLWGTKPGDFNGTALPTQLDGTGVTVNGKAAYVVYISPTQINILTPLDSAQGNVPVVVNNSGSPSNTFLTPMQTLSPAIFTLNDAHTWAAAQYVSGAFAAPPGAFPGSTPARAGDVLGLWVTGLGQTSPGIPDGVILPSNRDVMAPIEVTIGGLPATIQYAGLVGAGLYQMNVVIPSGLPAGDAAIVIRTQGFQTQPGVIIPIQN